jgi:CBS domain-containing protein
MQAGKLLAIGTARDLVRRVGDDRYVVWTQTPDHPALSGIGRREVMAAEESVRSGWIPVSVRAVGGERASAEILTELVQAGVSISRFERAKVSLAELIEAVIRTTPENGHNGAPENGDK